MSYLFLEQQELKDAPFNGGISTKELREYAERKYLSQGVKDYLYTLPDDEIYYSLEELFGEPTDSEVERPDFSHD